MYGRKTTFVARINVEDTLWSDPRFMKLCIKLGDQFRAAGAVLYAWKYAQKYWCPNKKPIPLQDFINSGIPAEIIACGLAEELDDGIKIKGSEEHFAWWFEKRRAGSVGGRVSAQRPRNKSGQLLPSKTQALLGECLVKNQASISYSFSNKEYKTLVQKPSPSAPVFDFFLVYQAYPRKTGKKAGLAKLAKLIKTQDQYDLLLTKVCEFREKCRDKELKYIPHFSTYVNQERWLDADEESTKQIVEWEDGTRTLVDKKHEPTTKIIWDEDNQ